MKLLMHLDGAAEPTQKSFTYLWLIFKHTLNAKKAFYFTQQSLELERLPFYQRKFLAYELPSLIAHKADIAGAADESILPWKGEERPCLQKFTPGYDFVGTLDRWIQFSEIIFAEDQALIPDHFGFRHWRNVCCLHLTGSTERC